MTINFISKQRLLRRGHFFFLLFCFSLFFLNGNFCEPCCCFLSMIESSFESSVIGPYSECSMIRSSLVSSEIALFLDYSVIKSSLGLSVTGSSLGFSVLFFQYASLKTSLKSKLVSLFENR